MLSMRIWKKISLFLGICFILIPIFMIFFGPWLATITKTKPFSGRARAMISFFWIWMFIYNGIGYILQYKDSEKCEILLVLAIPAAIVFTILQIIYLSIGYFELVLSEIIWAVCRLIWTILSLLYFIDKKNNEKINLNG